MPPTLLDDAARARAEELILDELFDLRLYERLRDISSGPLKEMLARLVGVEIKHHAFWESFFGITRSRLDLGRRIKLVIVSAVCRWAGAASVHLVLEGIEIYGIRKYLRLWDAYQGTPFGRALTDILKDEFEHEDEIVSSYAARRINPERVRGLFLGFNDGLVEILGAVSGFFTALRAPRLVAGAGIAVAVAGALSMAAGAFASTSSEREMNFIERGKARFLGKSESDASPTSSWSVAAIVGASYFVGASVPMIPVLLGATNVLASVAAGVVAAVVVSSVLAFLSGMNVRRRVGLNLASVVIAVLVSSAIGALAHRFFGAEV